MRHLSAPACQVICTALVTVMIFVGEHAAAASSQSTANAEFDQAISTLDRRSELLHRGTKQLLYAIKEKAKLEIIRKRNALEDQLEDWRDADSVDGAGFNDKFEEALLIGQSYGLDPNRMRKLYGLLKKAILRADLRQAGKTYAEDEPSFTTSVGAYFDWLGNQEKELAENSANRQEKRLRLFKSTALIFFEALIESDAALAHEKFARLKSALQTIQGADADILRVEADMIVATQKLIADVVAGVPVLGETLDLYALTTGETIAGEKLSGTEQGMTFLFLLPAVGDIIQVARRTPAAAKAMGHVCAAIDAAKKENLEFMAAVYKRTVGDLKDLAKRLRQSPKVAAIAARLDAGRLAKRSDDFLDDFGRTGVGEEAEKVWQEAVSGAQAKVDALAEELKHADYQTAKLNDNPSFLEQYKNVRQDNQAVKALKNSDDQKLRNAVFDFEKNLHEVVDDNAIKGITDDLNLAIGRLDDTKKTVQDVGQAKSALDEAQSALADARKGGDAGAIAKAENGVSSAKKKLGDAKAKMNNLPPADKAALNIDATIRRDHIASGGKGPKSITDLDELDVEVMNVSNTPPKRGDIGSDRDITYQIKTGGGSKVDVPHDIAKDHYNKSLYESLNPGSGKINLGNPADMKKANAFGDQMDHVVTSSTHGEAYHLYKGDLKNVLGGNPKMLDMGDAISVEPTMQHKGFHWLNAADEAAKAGNPGLAMVRKAEGMRQMTKQFDNMLAPRIKKLGLEAENILPPKALEAYRLFKKVDAGSLSPAKAEAALKNMGLSMEQSFELIAQGLPRVTQYSRAKSSAGIIKLLNKGSITAERAKAALNRIGVSMAEGRRLASEFPAYQRQYGGGG